MAGGFTETEVGMLGEHALGTSRLTDLANRSSETNLRSILAPATPHFGMAENTSLAIPANTITLSSPIDSHLIHAVTASLPLLDMHAARTPKPPTPGPETASSGQHPSPEVSRPLNVTDALSYLDAVKNQFNDNPDVYNQFLDIMKDFKSQVIDTPGVIQRVSRLFTGNPRLIQGFNTFLPMGYRIDISADPNTITVTTPLGITTQNTNVNAPDVRTGQELPIPPHQPHPNQLLYPIPAPLIQNIPGGAVSRSHTPHAFHPGHAQPQFDPMYSPGVPNPQTTAAASFLGTLHNNKASVERPSHGGPGEFNHAIQYLNRIKSRYGDDPNTYKQFLDILQTYQKEQRHSHESQVYTQVQMLFKDSPDLLAEFKAFFSEVPGAVATLPQPLLGSSWAQGESSPPGAPAKKPQTNKRTRKRPPEKDTTPIPLPKPLPQRQSKKVKHHHNQDNESIPFSYAIPSPPPSHSYPQGAPQIHGQTHPMHHPQDYQNNSSAGKLLFFDRAKKSLENRDVYDDFLKLLNLFSKDVINVETLIERAKVFLGDGELMAEFKDLMGWDDRDKIERGPPGSIRTGPPELPAALPVDDGEGPSYRKLPPSETDLACSGRDELCRSVLNDLWVSHPTWASEDSGFVAHKKTIFEESVHKSEEERHEYHVQIEALVRTIAVLEPINSRIDEMTNEERSFFRLKPDFGGSSMAIYHRIIKKIYGRDMGLEVIQALQDCPSVAVPVVLSRLKQKDEEWRRAQREWSRMWKEVDSKNFYKALDHQGINFKQNDKKNITAKHFVTDIQNVKKQQLKKWEWKGTHAFAHGSVGHQLEYSFKNMAVLQDTLKLVSLFLERSPVQYSPHERRGVEKFLRSFVPMLCMTTEAEFKSSGPSDGSAAPEDDSVPERETHTVDAGSRSGGRRSTGSGHGGPGMHSGGIPANDLRKKLLKTAQEKASKKELRAVSSGVGSRAASPSSAGHRSPHIPRVEDELLEPQDVWIKEGAPRSSSSSVTDIVSAPSDKDRPFFANTTFYTLLRLLELLHSRLLMCYEIGAQYAAEKHASLLANPVAVDLGLDDPNGPASVLHQTMDALGKPAPEDKNLVYIYLLSACEKLFDNELDQATFEEHMRWFFGAKAYMLFTLDKTIIAFVKQVQTVLGDNKCQELWSLLKSAQNSKNISRQDIIRYRREAERHVGQDDHLYRIQWVRETKCIRVSLCSTDEPSVLGDGSPLSRWREYVSTYVMTHPTEWLPEPKETSNPVFLKRCVREAAEDTAIDDHMRVRVSLPSYKLVYEAGCEDFIFHRWRNEGAVLETRAKGRDEERRKSRWLLH